MTDDTPIMCTLAPEELVARRDRSLRDLVQRADAHEERPHGHRLRFRADSDTLMTIARVVDAERRCCRFLRFDLTVEPNGGAMWLELTGPAGTREFLAELLRR